MLTKNLLFLLLLVVPGCLFSQEKISVKYFKNINLKKETVEEKANYKMISTSSDTNLTVELFKIGTNQLIWHKSFLDSIPFGKWYFFNENTLTTDTLIYGKIVPQENYYSYDIKNQKLSNEIDGEFIKPKLTGVDKSINTWAEQHKCSDIAAWVAFNIRYPVEAQSNGIQGQVQMQFTINENGETENVRIINGVHLLLDNEAYRLLKALPVFQPAKLDGNSIKLHIETPINFLLR